MPDGNHESIAKLWTKLGEFLVLSSLPFIFFIRGGANIFRKDIASAAVQITMAGWGVLGFSLGLCGLSILGLIYIKRSGGGFSATPWPPDTNFESEANRDTLASKFFLILYSTAPIISIIFGVIRYTDSHISQWKPATLLAQGFIQSRILAYRMGCQEPPCFRIHPENGHEYILYVTDGVLIVAVVSSTILWFIWIIAIRKVTSSPTSEG